MADPTDDGDIVPARSARFGPCNFCGQPLVRLPNSQWGVAGDSTGKNCAPSPDGWHQADRLSDGSFSIGSDIWPGLSKAIEEAGEFLQVAGKVIATHGAAAHWDGSDLRERFIEEAADLFAALNFVLGESFTVAERIAVGERMTSKMRLFREWQDEQGSGGGRCMGDRRCTATTHVHGCYADDHGACDAPDEHKRTSGHIGSFDPPAAQPSPE